MNMAYIGEYRTRSGRFYFKWSFEPQNDTTIRIYIAKAPGYENRPTDAHSTHRYTDAGGRCYICYDPMPTSMKDAIAIAKAWAERTEDYIVNSREF